MILLYSDIFLHKKREDELTSPLLITLITNYPTNTFVESKNDKTIVTTAVTASSPQIT